MRRLRSRVGGYQGQSCGTGLGLLKPRLGGVTLSRLSRPPGPLCTPDLDGEVLGHHAVSGRQVSVHKLVGSEVGHAIRDLTSHLDHISQCWPREPRVVLEPREGASEVGT